MDSRVIVARPIAVRPRISPDTLPMNWSLHAWILGWNSGAPPCRRSPACRSASRIDRRGTWRVGEPRDARDRDARANVGHQAIEERRAQPTADGLRAGRASERAGLGQVESTFRRSRS